MNIAYSLKNLYRIWNSVTKDVLFSTQFGSMADRFAIPHPINTTWEREPPGFRVSHKKHPAKNALGRMNI